MVFVQLLGLASCSFCMFNSLILSISLSFSVFFFILRQFGQLLCFASCKLSFLSLFLCSPLCFPLPLSVFPVQFSFFLFLSISLSFSPFLSFSALLALASSYFFFYLSFSVLNYTSCICSESFNCYICLSLILCLYLYFSVSSFSLCQTLFKERTQCPRKL